MIGQDNYEWDPAKRLRNVERHGIDFQDALRIWDGPTLQRASDFAAESRFISFGVTGGRMVAVVWAREAGNAGSYRQG